MVIKSKTLIHYTLQCNDGEIGKVKNFYFDDQFWTIRYLVADTGNWLTNRQVLISPYAISSVDTENEQIHINLSKKEIETSPSLDTDKPVSRQFEQNYFHHYDWPVYWSGSMMWGDYQEIDRTRKHAFNTNEGGKPRDCNLRSIESVCGHHIQATDSSLGHVVDFIIDDASWTIRYLIIDTVNWWFGKKIIVSPLWINRVSWSESKVFINLKSDSIKDFPEYTDDVLLSRDYEEKLHKHHQRKEYWVA